MGEMKIKLPDGIEKAFRRLAMKRFGYQKGSMSEAAKEAIGGWTEMHEEEEVEKDQNWDSFIGIMKQVKKSSVELQHEAWGNVIKKYRKKERKRNASRR